MLGIAGEELSGTAVPAALPSITAMTLATSNPSRRTIRAVGTGRVGVPACGDVVKLPIKVDGASGTIVDARFKTFGAFGHRFFLCWEIAKHLALPPVKLHCSMLAEDVVVAAVKNYEAKHAKSNGGPDANPKAVNA